MSEIFIIFLIISGMQIQKNGLNLLYWVYYESVKSVSSNPYIV